MEKSPAHTAIAKPLINQLEMHVTHACNLSCESCSHFSNHNIKGNLDPDEADQWMSNWSSRVDVRVFALVGGEPTLHKDLSKFPPLVRRHWPDCEVWIITNGFFLYRHPRLPAALNEAGNCKLFMSVHHEGPDYLTRVQPVFELLEAWKQEHGTSVTIWPASARWTRRYHGFGASLEPYKDAQPRQSWENCVARKSPQLFLGDLWKCPPITYLPLQKQRYLLSSNWNQYLDYRPLPAGCSDDELVAFLAREDEAICSMCPAKPERFELRNPMINSANER